jgi:hypothetical protein
MGGSGFFGGYAAGLGCYESLARKLCLQNHNQLVDFCAFRIVRPWYRLDNCELEEMESCYEESR